MGSIWLRRLPQFFDKWGLDWDAWPGWERRARQSNTCGYEAVQAIQAHQTVSRTTLTNDARYCWENAPTKPIGSVLLGRDGKVLLGAAGATNTSGKGGPMLTANGVIPLNVGNTRIFAIEACNDGLGEPWPSKQQDEYLRLVCAVKDCIDSVGINRNPIGFGDIHAHREWAPDRKVDPRGPSRWAYPNSWMWDMDRFRFDCAVTWLGKYPLPTPGPTPDPTPIPPPSPTGDEMYFVWKNSAGGYNVGVPGCWGCHIDSDDMKRLPFANGPAINLANGKFVTSWSDVTTVDTNAAKAKMGVWLGDNYGV